MLKLKFMISDQQAEQVQSKIEELKSSPGEYVYSSRNCVDVAIEIFKTIGTDHPFNHFTWEQMTNEVLESPAVLYGLAKYRLGIPVPMLPNELIKNPSDYIRSLCKRAGLAGIAVIGLIALISKTGLHQLSEDLVDGPKAIGTFSVVGISRAAMLASALTGILGVSLPQVPGNEQIVNLFVVVFCAAFVAQFMYKAFSRLCT